MGDCGIINANGINTIKIAFSCTCQPKRKEPNPVRTSDFINTSAFGFFHNTDRIGYINTLYQL
jgi:hypothetical protein